MNCWPTICCHHGKLPLFSLDSQGLAAAHAAGLIHRDVKPANVLFDEPGGRAKLTDFGLVRASQTQELTQTQTDFICGTPEYMSPEQAHQPDRVDARSDVYSLGITLYECLTGVPPYRGRPLDILNQHRLGDPTPPSRLNRNIPAISKRYASKRLRQSPMIDTVQPLGWRTTCRGSSSRVR